MDTVTIYHVITNCGRKAYTLFRPNSRYCAVISTATITLPKGVEARPYGGWTALQRGVHSTMSLKSEGGRIFAELGGETVNICAEF